MRKELLSEGKVTFLSEIYRFSERESPLLQMWDKSEVEPGVSSDTLMVRLFNF